MLNSKQLLLTLVMSLGISTVDAQIAHAQASDTGSASATKQTQKAERKAERKVRRAKKNSELGRLESKGYRPAADQANYPVDFQNAQKNVDAEKGQAAKGASSP